MIRAIIIIATVMMMMLRWRWGRNGIVVVAVVVIHDHDSITRHDGTSAVIHSVRVVAVITGHTVHVVVARAGSASTSTVIMIVIIRHVLLMMRQILLLLLSVEKFGDGDRHAATTWGSTSRFGTWAVQWLLLLLLFY